jgi:hypothetical protein
MPVGDAEVVLEDRDPAPVPVSLEAFADDRGSDRGIGSEERRDHVHERVELRALGRTGVPRRLAALQEPIHRVAAHRQLPGDRRLRAALR